MRGEYLALKMAKNSLLVRGTLHADGAEGIGCLGYERLWGVLQLRKNAEMFPIRFQDLFASASMDHSCDAGC